MSSPIVCLYTYVHFPPLASGFNGELGDCPRTLEAGKLADLDIVNTDPLSDLPVMNNIEVVIQGGRVVVDHR